MIEGRERSDDYARAATVNLGERRADLARSNLTLVLFKKIHRFPFLACYT
jgi:hypothetical protein